MRKSIVFVAIAAWIVVALAAVALAMNVTINIPMQDVNVRETARGDSYVVRFDLPADLAGKRLDSVFLDFIVDTTPTSEAEAEATPLVAVYPLTVAATDAILEYEGDVPSVRPVAMGEGQQVQADITDIVKGWLSNPSRNHGLIIGTLAGPDVATVSLKSSAVDGAAVRVTFFYQNRSGERLSDR